MHKRFIIYYWTKLLPPVTSFTLEVIFLIEDLLLVLLPFTSEVVFRVISLLLITLYFVFELLIWVKRSVALLMFSVIKLTMWISNGIYKHDPLMWYIIILAFLYSFAPKIWIVFCIIDDHFYFENGNAPSMEVVNKWWDERQPLPKLKGGCTIDDWFDILRKDETIEEDLENEYGLDPKAWAEILKRIKAERCEVKRVKPFMEWCLENSFE